MELVDNEIRDDVRQAVQGVSDKWDREYYLGRALSGGYVTEQWQALADQGLLGLGVPEELGGSGGGITGPVAVMEALSQVGTPPLLYLITCFARVPIIHFGNDEQKKKYVTPTVTGEERLCFAITEPDAGTNAFRMSTLAKRDGDEYVVNGQKTFISGADESDHCLLVCRTTAAADVGDRREGLSLFVVDLNNTPGITLQAQAIDLKMPERQFTVYFDDARIPVESRIGDEGDGFRYVFSALNAERLIVSAWATGAGDFALEKAVAYARERAPFSSPIGSYQAIQHPLARAKTQLDGARLMLYRACEMFEAGEDPGAAANMAKLMASEAAGMAIDAAIQTHGGSAFDDDSDVMTLLPMIRLLRIAPINNEMVLNYISERVLRLPKSY